MKCLATILGVVGVICCVVEGNVYAQPFTVQAGNWNSPDTWNNGVVPDFTHGTITINHAVTITDATLTLDEVVVNETLTIEETASVTITYSGTGADLKVEAGTVQVFGKLICNDLVTIQTNAANLTFNEGSVYEHRYVTVAGEPPAATWHINSTVLITGYVTSRSLNTVGWQQHFGNVTYNCAQQSVSSFVEMLGNVRNIGGNFHIQNTNGGVLRLTRSQTQLLTINIGGDFIIEGNSEVWISFEGTTQMNVAGNFEFRSTSGGASYITTSGNSELHVGGNVLINSNAAFRLASSGGGTGVFRVAGNLLMTSGQLDVETPGIGVLELTGSTAQTISLVNDLPGTITLINNNPTEVELITNDELLGSIQSNAGRLILPDAFSLYGDLVVSEAASVQYPEVLSINGTINQQLDLHGDTLVNVSMNKAAGTALTLQSEMFLKGYLHIQSSNTDLISNGNLTLLSQSDDGMQDASIYTLPDGSEVVGNVQVQRYMEGEGRIYRYISVPISNATVASLQDDFAITGTFTDPSTGPGINKSAPSFYFYDEALSESQGWTPFPQAGFAQDALLQAGLGYAAFIRKASTATIWDVTGTINQGEIPLPVSFHDYEDTNNDGWNLVGNPYPATIDWDIITGWEKFNVEAGIYIRENGSKQFLFWDGDIGNLGSGRIAKGQSFWVKTNGINPVLKVKETAKVITSAPFYRAGNEVIDYLEITVSSATTKDNTYLRIRPDATAGYEHKDVIKRNNDELNISILQDEVSMAIAATDKINCDTPIPLQIGFASDQLLPAGQYRLQVSSYGVFTLHTVHLLDSYTQRTISIMDSTYTFQITDDVESKQSNRFQLVIKPIELPADFSVTHDAVFCQDASYTIQLNNLPSDWIFSLADWKEIRHSSGATVQHEQLDLHDFTEDTLHIDFKIQQACSTTLFSWKSPRFQSPVITEDNGTLYSSGSTNEWYAEGNLIAGAHDQQYTPQHSGLVAVKSKSGKCEAVTYYDFTFQETYPVVYPNPAYESMMCLAPVGELIQSYVMTDSYGRIILTNQQPEHVKQIEADISDLKPGMYVVHMQTTQGNYSIKIFKR